MKINTMVILIFLFLKTFIYAQFEMEKLIDLQESNDVLMGYPVDIALDNHHLYVMDIQLFKVHVFDRNGKYIRSFGERGQGPGEFQLPLFITAVNDTIYIADRNKRAIILYNSNGAYLNSLKIDFNVYAIAAAPGGILFATYFSEHMKEPLIKIYKNCEYFGAFIQPVNRLEEQNGFYNACRLTYDADNKLLYVGRKYPYEISIYKFTDNKLIHKKNISKEMYEQPEPIIKKIIRGDQTITKMIGISCVYSMAISKNYLFNSFGSDQGAYAKYVDKNIALKCKNRIDIFDRRTGKFLGSTFHKDLTEYRENEDGARPGNYNKVRR